MKRPGSVSRSNRAPAEAGIGEGGKGAVSIPRAATLGRHEKLQAALVEAAEQAIAAQGLAALRARALAEVVGCSVGAIYTIFPDLDGIILAVNARTLAAIDRTLQEGRDTAEPARQLCRLAADYLDYAAENRLRWQALFLHTMTPGHFAPDWYAHQQQAAFSHIEAPLARLCPGMAAPDRALLARSLFSAVHGMVALGLDEKVAAMPLDVLHAQIATVVTAMATGLAGRPGKPSPSGKGPGQGAGHAAARPDAPHPGPLPEGEPGARG